MCLWKKFENRRIDSEHTTHIKNKQRRRTFGFDYLPALTINSKRNPLPLNQSGLPTGENERIGFYMYVKRVRNSIANIVYLNIVGP